MQSWFPLLLAVGCGTPDITDVVELYPEITVSTDAIEFGDVGVPLTVEQDLTINNGGRADLHLQLALDGEGKAAYDLPVHDAVLAPDDRAYTLRTDDDGNEVVIFRFSPADRVEGVAS